MEQRELLGPEATSKTAPKRRKVKSQSAEGVVDAHERTKRDFLNRIDRLPGLFLSTRGGQTTRQGWSYLVTEAGQRAGLVVHPHMLRHICGHLLADAGADTRVLQDYLGHRDIRHTPLYSRTASRRFESLWRR